MSQNTANVILTKVKLENTGVAYLRTVFSTVPYACKCMCILYSLLFHVPVYVYAYCVQYCSMYLYKYVHNVFSSVLFVYKCTRIPIRCDVVMH